MCDDSGMLGKKNAFNLRTSTADRVVALCFVLLAPCYWLVAMVAAAVPALPCSRSSSTLATPTHVLVSSSCNKCKDKEHMKYFRAS